MAQRTLSSAVGDALLTFIELTWPKVTAGVDELIERVADHVRPDPPMTIRTLDGQTVTGVLVANRGQVLFFIGTREAAPCIVTPPPRHPLDDGDLWQGRVDPYRR